MKSPADLIAFLTYRRDHARAEEERHRSNPALDLQRRLTSAEDAVYWAAFEAGLAEAYGTVLRELGES
jgi:hypothetical protein